MNDIVQFNLPISHVSHVIGALDSNYDIPNIGVKSISNHLAICWARDLYSPVDETWRSFSPRTVLPYMPRLWQEVWQGPFVELHRDHTGLERILSSSIERIDGGGPGKPR